MTIVNLCGDKAHREVVPPGRGASPPRPLCCGLRVAFLAICAALAACGPARSGNSEETLPSSRSASLSAAPAMSPVLPISMPVPTESQEQVAIAAGQGIYLVVWMSGVTHTPNIQGVRVRASDGALLDSTPILIADAQGGNPRWEPAVAFDGSNFLVVWTAIDGAPTIRGARVRASDGAVLDTAPLLISRMPAQDNGVLPQQHAAVAFDGAGNYLVTWDGMMSANGRYYYGIMGIRVRASDGSCVESTASLIGPGNASRVAYAQGHFLVMWHRGGNVEATRVSALTGQVVDTSPILVGAAAADAAVAARHDAFLVVWRGTDGGLRGRHVRASDGVKLGTADIAVGPAAVSPTDVAFDGQDYWISWQGTRDGVRKALTTRVTSEGVVAPDGELVLGEVLAGSGTQRGGIAAAGSGLVLSAWVTGDAAVGRLRGRMRLVTTGRMHVSPERSPSPWPASLGNSDAPAVAASKELYLVAWAQSRAAPSTGTEIVAMRVRASDGVPLDASPLHLSGSSGTARFPDVAFDGSNFLVVWSSDDSFHVHGARVRASDGALLDPTPVLLTLPVSNPLLRSVGKNVTVAFDGTNYLATWVGSLISYNTRNGILGTHVNAADGTPIEPESIPINAVYLEEWEYTSAPDVAYAGGYYLVVWTRGTRVLAMRINGSTGERVELTDYQWLTSSIGARSHALASRDDEFLVLWRGTDGGLWGRRIRASDGANLSVGDIFVGPGLLGTPSVTFDGTDYRVAWPASRGGGQVLVTTRISLTGVVAADEEQRLAPLQVGADASLGARLAATEPGSFLVTYLQKDPVLGNRVRMRLVNEAPADCDSRDPVLSLNGSAEPTLECGAGSYRDPGAVAIDGCGRPLQVHAYNSGQDSSGPGPNPGVEGTYTVSYATWDAAGHTANALRTVTVDDRTPPRLTLLGAAHMTHTCGSQWVDPGVQATDACYGNLTPQVWHTGEVNGWVAGTYTVTYSLTDSGGNTATPVTRTVDVIDCPW